MRNGSWLGAVGCLCWLLTGFEASAIEPGMRPPEEASGRPSAEAGQSPVDPVEFPADALADLKESPSVGPTMALPATGRTIDLSATARDAVTIREDPLPGVDPVPAGMAVLPPTDAHDTLGGPFRLLGDQFVVSVGRNKLGSPEETRGRLAVASLRTGACEVVWDSSRALKVLGHHQPTGRTLIVDGFDQFQRAGELLILEGVADGMPRELYRRALPGLGKPGFQPMLEWACLLSGSHVAAIFDDTLLVWDMPAARLLYRVENVRATEPPAFSGSQRFMAVSHRGGDVTVRETATGDVVQTLSTDHVLAAGLAFHPSGRQLAVCFSNRYVVWDWLDDRIVAEAVTSDTLGSAPTAWLNDTQFLTGLGNVVDVDLGMPFWKYLVDVATDPLMIGDKLVTLATQNPAAVVSIATPHPTAMQARQQLHQLMEAGDEAMLVRPGTEVAIAVEGVAAAESAAIEQALTTLAEKAGWSVSRQAGIALVVKMGRGEEQQISYRMIGGRSRDASTATLVARQAELEVRSGANVLWQRFLCAHAAPTRGRRDGAGGREAV